MGELGFAVLHGFFFVSAHMPVEISMERAATRLDMLWGVLNWALKAKRLPLVGRVFEFLAIHPEGRRTPSPRVTESLRRAGTGLRLVLRLPRRGSSPNGAALVRKKHYANKVLASLRSF